MLCINRSTSMYTYICIYIQPLYSLNICTCIYTSVWGCSFVSVEECLCVCVSAYLAVHMQNVCTNNQFVSRCECECICKWLYKCESEKERDLVYMFVYVVSTKINPAHFTISFSSFLVTFYILFFFLLLNNFIGVSSYGCFSLCFLFCLAFHIYLVTVSQAQFCKTLK